MLPLNQLVQKLYKSTNTITIKASSLRLVENLKPMNENKLARRLIESKSEEIRSRGLTKARLGRVTI